MLVEQSSETTSSGGPGHEQRVWERRDEGRLAVHADGYGYLVYAGGDSVYVPPQNLRWLGLEDGDRIVIDIASRTIDVRLSQEELDRRRAALASFAPRHRDRTVSRALKAYAAMVASADKGGVRIVE